MKTIKILLTLKPFLEMKIRKIKKAMKKSNGFFTIITDANICICVSEWNTVRYHKKGFSMDDSIYLPYRQIRKVISESSKRQN